MKFFSKEEIKAVAIILGILIIISAPNFYLSLQRARDAQRKADLGLVHDSLLRYQADFGTFPLAIDGKLAACEPVSVKEENGLKTYVYSPCQWGKDKLQDLADPSYPAYIKVIPDDPQKSKGYGYYYFSNGSTFQVYGTLEGKNEDEYDESIIKRGLKCGEKICNFGRSFAKTPLNVSIEEYLQSINR